MLNKDKATDQHGQTLPSLSLVPIDEPPLSPLFDVTHKKIVRQPAKQVNQIAGFVQKKRQEVAAYLLEQEALLASQISIIDAKAEVEQAAKLKQIEASASIAQQKLNDQAELISTQLQATKLAREEAENEAKFGIFEVALEDLKEQIKRFEILMSNGIIDQEILTIEVNRLKKRFMQRLVDLEINQNSAASFLQRCTEKRNTE
jgi:hypothetical protein